MALNFDATVRMTEALLPLLRALRAQRDRQRVERGRARRARGSSGGYSASKFALAGWSDALYAEERAERRARRPRPARFVTTEGFPQPELHAKRADAPPGLDPRQGRRGDRRRGPRRQGRALRPARLLACCRGCGSWPRGVRRARAAGGGAMTPATAGDAAITGNRPRGTKWETKNTTSREAPIEERGAPAYVAEFMGTFFLVLFVSSVVSLNSADGLGFTDWSVIGLVHFLLLAMLIYSLGHAPARISTPR